jgi:GAF domain-containing protein
VKSEKDNSGAVNQDSMKRRPTEEEPRFPREESLLPADESAVVAEIGQVIGSSPDIDTVFERFAAQVGRFIPFDRLTISLDNHQDNTLTVTFSYGTGLPGRKQGDKIPLAGSLNEHLIRTRKAVIFDMGSPERLAVEFPTLLNSYRAGFRSCICAPLITRNEMIGILNFRSLKPAVYNETHLRLATRIGEPLAGAIAAARRFGRL